MKVFFLISVFSAYSSVLMASAWESHSNPLILDRSLNLQFDDSIISGQVQDLRTAWPGSHWSNWLGGIAHRWSARDPQNFRYKLNRLEDLKKLYPHEIDELSPTEKMDIYRGDYSYSTTKTELNRVSPFESKWHGLCHGYAPAAVNHPEPQTVSLTNNDGIEVTFYSGDVTALLALYYAEYANTPVQFVGRRCKSSRGLRVWNRGSCVPLNAGSFHVGLTNKLALQGEGLIFDIEPGFEVWNFVARSFETRYVSTEEVGANSAREAVKRIRIQTEVEFGADINPKMKPVLFSEEAYYIYRWYEYYVEVDKDNNIVGGEWVTDNGPDFMWSQHKANFKGKWSVLNEIYRPVEMPQ